MMRIGSIAIAAMICALCACGGGTHDSDVHKPGGVKSSSTRLLESRADFLQDKPPLAAINTYLDGFHFYNGRMHEQMEAHHYCSILNEELIQCVIYDGNHSDAKIVGVEYIISERLFNTLPDAEKALWHSHVHEVKSGQLVAPGIPPFAERQLMEKLAHTYGKTWHTWHPGQHRELPLGIPQLMMGFTADGQIDQALLRQRDERLDIDSVQKRQDRANIPNPSIAPGADAWLEGNTVQLEDPTDVEHHSPGGSQHTPTKQPPRAR